MTSESETLLSKTITYSVSFRDFSIFARIHGAEDIREESNRSIGPHCLEWFCVPFF